MAVSTEGIKRSSADAADEQLPEIKKIRREETKSFKRKGNKIQYTFNAKLQDSLVEVKSNRNPTSSKTWILVRLKLDIFTLRVCPWDSTAIFIFFCHFTVPS